ncbi:hypothetical protein Pmar_PMAR014382 [Perkinsus marinus ATCC 50983]|uniref:Uncharacterized protein n=1 Tax=Perkinsus marinus (strain ATCC 50983 / TXsc) TaxID=423536 RepID=C5KYN6_PERM5|nr:hypothetical protein Pmar_PMAR014382 [Perkinsus marinus ATCC 50983]EER10407.1 hypothetical protein Pmar_PMAR014382 [Perkinsus marinus ATCC 50983]|eukprot:XP_002778612.1 hypothetical protein Pmar_PMAR014382 [Perkinsus marinus ATCC 50983]
MAAFNTSLDSSEQEELLKEYQSNRVMPELPQFEEPVRKTSSRKQHEAEKNQRSVASEKAASSVVEEKPVSKARGGGRKSSKGSKKEASSSQVEAKEEVAVSNTTKTVTRAKASNKPSTLTLSGRSSCATLGIDVELFRRCVRQWNLKSLNWRICQAGCRTIRIGGLNAANLHEFRLRLKLIKLICMRVRSVY